MRRPWQRRSKAEQPPTDDEILGSVDFTPTCDCWRPDETKCGNPVQISRTCRYCRHVTFACGECHAATILATAVYRALVQCVGCGFTGRHVFLHYDIEFLRGAK